MTITNVASPGRAAEQFATLVAPTVVSKTTSNSPLPLLKQVKHKLETNSGTPLSSDEWRLKGIEQLRQELPGYTPTTTGANYDPANTENSKNQSYFGSDPSDDERSQGYTFKSDTAFVMSRCAGKQEIGRLAKGPDRTS